MLANEITAESARQQFLQLLVTQLRNQDPFEPVKQEEFLSQLAQFSTLEGIENLNTRFDDLLKLQELTDGANLLGRTVTFDAAEGGGRQQGVVQAVRVETGQLVLDVGGKAVPIDRIQGLVDAASS